MEKLRPISIIVTASNCSTVPGQIGCLREVKERDIRIIGTDMEKEGAGSRFVDQFYLVPAAFSPDYIDKMIEICQKEKVDAIIPTCDEEFIELSREKARFDEIGTKIVTSDHDVILRSSDKGNFLNFLKENNFPCAKFSIPKNVSDFERACFEFGYPERPVVIKPRRSRGNRGFRIIKSDINKADMLLNQRPGAPYMIFEDAKDILSRGENFPDIVVMEYLPGKEYSVDILAKNGEALVIVPKLRLSIVPGLSVIGQVDMNPEVIRAVREITLLFKLNYNANIQFRYSQEGKLYPYEINPRVAASIACCSAAGANLMYWGTKLALGEEIPELSNLKIKNGLKFLRYYKEHYEEQ